MAATEASTQIALLHQISSIVSSGVDIEKTLQELISLAVDVTDCDACLVYLLDRKTQEIVLRASQQPHAQEIGNIRMKMGEGITGWVAEHRSVVALPSNAASDARFKRFHSLPEDTYEAFLSVPLIGDGELIGVINIHHRPRHKHTHDEQHGDLHRRADGRRIYQVLARRALGRRHTAHGSPGWVGAHHRRA